MVIYPSRAIVAASLAASARSSRMARMTSGRSPISMVERMGMLLDSVRTFSYGIIGVVRVTQPASRRSLW